MNGAKKKNRTLEKISKTKISRSPETFNPLKTVQMDKSAYSKTIRQSPSTVKSNAPKIVFNEKPFVSTQYVRNFTD